MVGKIGTHSGTFHCDEILACAMLKKLPEYAEMQIVRSRDPAVLAECDIVVDVGAVYDHATKRYDHHQATFDKTMSSIHPELNFSIKLSSAGLIYAHYGERVIAQIIDKKEADPEISLIFKKLYQNFVMEIDAIDNGVKLCDGKTAYTICSDLSSRVGRFNPKWNDQIQDTNPGFHKALKMVDEEFTSVVKFLAESWIPARELVEKAYNERNNHHESGNLLVFKETAPVWKDHLLDIEYKDNVATSEDYQGRPVFCIYPRGDGNWSCQAIPAGSQQKFASRLLLKMEWWGFRDEELDRKLGFSGAVMVHANGFLGIHKTYDGAVKMATISLKTAGLI